MDILCTPHGSAGKAEQPGKAAIQAEPINMKGGSSGADSKTPPTAPDDLADAAKAEI